MSTGDIDDRLGPKGKLEELRAQYPKLDAYLARIPELVGRVQKCTLPYSAGISKDGQTPYIDERLNLDLNGKDLTPCLVTHECVEWALREFCNIGEEYQHDPAGHRLANRAEMAMAEQILGGGEGVWEMYDEFMDPQVRKIENSPITNVPKDLALYPYQGTAYLKQLKRAMG